MKTIQSKRHRHVFYRIIEISRIVEFMFGQGINLKRVIGRRGSIIMKHETSENALTKKRTGDIRH